MQESETPPRDYVALVALIAEKADRLPRRLMQVARHALENPDDIAFGTVASVAAGAEVPPSALVRFAHALGFQGFTDLQDVFRSRLRDRVMSYDERLIRMRGHGAASSRSGLLLQGFLEASDQSLARFRETVDHDAIERAVEKLAYAETIYLIGLRRSFPIASYMAYALAKLGVRTVLIDAVAGMGAEQAGFMTRRDAVLAISFSPYASETVALTNSARASGATIVSITDSVVSPIVPPAEIVLEVVEANFEGFRSMAVTMALALTLAASIAAFRAEMAGS